MFKTKKSQGLSIRTIIIVVIGLIVLFVVVGLLTGKIDVYSSGIKELTTCENTCKNIGYTKSFAWSDNSCKVNGGNVVFGTYSDVSGENDLGVKLRCCCINIET